MMRIGAGRAGWKLPDGFLPAEGFAEVVDPLHVRMLLLDDDSPFALVSIEITSLPQEEVDALNEIVQAKTNIPRSRIWICATHTFSAPHIMPDHALKTEADRKSKETLQAVIRQAVREACQKAKQDTREAMATLSQGESHVNTNRDIETDAGWWVGNTGTGFSDKTLSVVRLYAEDRPIAFILHYAVQSSVLDGSILSSGGKAISSDLAGIACARLEAMYPGTVAIFLLGAAGDQAPIEKAKTLHRRPDGAYEEADAGDAGIAMSRRLGEQLARDAAQIIEATACGCHDAQIGLAEATIRLPAQKMPGSIRDLKPTRTYEYTAAGETEQTIQVCTVGNTAVVGVKPELSGITAKQIADASPFRHTFVATMVNGGAKYMADAASYDRMTYEAMNSPFGKGAAEILAAEAVALLKQCHE